MLSNQREYTIFVVGLLIGFVAGYLVFGLAGGQDANTTPQQNEDTQPNATSTENGDTSNENDSQDTGATDEALSLSVDDQPSGMNVSVSEVTLSEPAWVAVREQNDDGTAGRILGAKLFPEGTNNGEITLLRRTIPETTYYATVYTDDGDHEFEFDSDDKPMTNTSGETILVEFKTNPASPN